MRAPFDYCGGNFAGPIEKYFGPAYKVLKFIYDEYDTIKNLLQVRAVPYVETLTVTALNQVSNLTHNYDNFYAILFINGQGYTSNDPSPPFTISGKVLTWYPDRVDGLQLTPGVTKVSIFYGSTLVPVTV